MNLSDIRTVKALLERHGFTFSKALGQNFIVDPSVCPRIAELGGAAPGRAVIEIGAGIGVLTAELAQCADRVIVIELDRRLLPVLSETLAEFDNITIINEDVLKVDLARLIAEELAGMEVVVCANLPYYITSPILMHLLESRLPVLSITVMVQREAALRICAPEGTRAVGAITYAVRYYSEPSVLFDVARDSFLPSPNVDSTVMRLDVRHEAPLPPEEERRLFRVVRGSFTQRRKTAANSISASLCIAKPAVLAALERVGIAPTARPEQLTLAQFTAIAQELSGLM